MCSVVISAMLSSCKTRTISAYTCTSLHLADVLKAVVQVCRQTIFKLCYFCGALIENVASCPVFSSSCYVPLAIETLSPIIVCGMFVLYVVTSS